MEEGREGAEQRKEISSFFLCFSRLCLSWLPHDCGTIAFVPLSGHLPVRVPAQCLTIGMASMLVVLHQIQGFPVCLTSLLTEGLPTLFSTVFF